MKNAILECLASPIKFRLITEIQMRGRVTAKQLAEAHSDIAPATLYRHLKKMTADNILQVVEENQVRGTIEKVYAVTENSAKDIQEIVLENDGEGYAMLFTQFVMGLMSEFGDYAKREDINIMEDGSGFSAAPVYATTEELTVALTKIGEVLMELVTNEKTPERDLHTIAMITTPPKKDLK